MKVKIRRDRAAFPAVAVSFLLTFAMILILTLSAVKRASLREAVFAPPVLETKEISLSGGEYSFVSLGAFEDAEEARLSAARLIYRGSAGCLYGENGEYLVLGNAYPEADEAEKAVSRLKKEGLSADTFTVRAPTVSLRLTAADAQAKAFIGCWESLIRGENALFEISRRLDAGEIDASAARAQLLVVQFAVAALVTRQELEGEIGDSTVGAQARLMSAALRKLTSLISKARTVCIFTNQIREKIGVMFGNPETTPGGRALKFYASVRCDIRRIGQIKGSDGSVSGNRTKLKIVKNKVAPPFKECEFDIMYNEGISSTGSLVDLAMEYDIVQKRGSWFSYNGSQIAQGRDGAKEALRTNPELYAEIEAKVRAKMDGTAE